MRRILLLLCLVVLWQTVVADSPTVPNTIQFAGLNLKLTDKARKKIQTEVDALTRSPKYFQIKVDRLQIYFPIIERIFREEGLPDDFKYLALQESALISDAVSSSNAVGFWQFKKEAAAEVGLRVNRNVDERLNIVASTRGAATYIKKNNRFYFDNWVHALLAYQQGPGGAQKLVNEKFRGSRSMPIDGRTHWYVIKFLAHKVAFEQVKSAEPSLFLVEDYEGQGKSLKEIAGAHRLDYDLVQQYNKWLKHGKVPTDGKYAVILPYDKQPQMLASTVRPGKSRELSTGVAQSGGMVYRTHPTKYPVITTYGRRNKGIKINGIKGIRLAQDMDLQSLERATGVSVKQLLYYNDVASNKKPRAGELWYLKRKKSKASENYHVAESGEDLWSISQKYGIRLRQLQRKNRIPKNQHTVKPGRVLYLSATRPSNVPANYIKPDPVSEPEQVTVISSPERDERNTETAKTASVDNFPESTETVINKRTDNPAKSKEILPVVSANEPSESSIANKKVHEVQPGETLYGIARKYHTSIEELQRLNNLNSSSVLSIGQRLKVDGNRNEGHLGSAVDKTTVPQFGVYTVKEGDTLYQIARDHNTTIKELMDLNGKFDFTLSIGEELKVPE
ncbi:MAG: hypothetical protein DHS20C17_17410 [Cyclobacteriaceae bacterium]|nr:MAG: hypothetical protein DHS20C17_17410 [Cyclobacteriaceae bacterium]